MCHKPDHLQVFPIRNTIYTGMLVVLETNMGDILAERFTPASHHCNRDYIFKLAHKTEPVKHMCNLTVLLL
jgi:hypothetical protein